MIPLTRQDRASPTAPARRPAFTDICRHNPSAAFAKLPAAGIF